MPVFRYKKCLRSFIYVVIAFYPAFCSAIAVKNNGIRDMLTFYERTDDLPALPVFIYIYADNDNLVWQFRFVKFFKRSGFGLEKSIIGSPKVDYNYMPPKTAKIKVLISL